MREALEVLSITLAIVGIVALGRFVILRRMEALDRGGYLGGVMKLSETQEALLWTVAAIVTAFLIAWFLGPNGDATAPWL